MEERISKEEVLEVNRLMRSYKITESKLRERTGFSCNEIRSCIRGKLPYPPVAQFRAIQEAVNAIVDYRIRQNKR